MIVLDLCLKKLAQVSRVKIDPYSLQFRLILGLVSLLFLGLSSLAMWTGWEMKQFLILTEQQKVEAMANRFIQDVEGYNITLPMETGLQLAIDRTSSPDLSMWVKFADGKIMKQSKAVTNSPTVFQTISISIKQIPSKNQVYKINGKQRLKYSSTLQVDSKTIGQLYIEQDINSGYTKLIAILQNLVIVTFLAFLALAVVFSLLIWRTLLPLRQMNQWMKTCTTELNPDQLKLNDTPSEIKALAKQWNRLSAHLSMDQEHQRQFINNIAHELRTPLTLVYGYLQRMQRRSDNLTNLQQEALSIATSETERTIDLLQNLIDLARVDIGSMSLHLDVLVLNDLIKDTARIVKKFGHRTIEIEATPLPVKVKGDKETLMQVLIQLIDNAAKYSDVIEPITLKLSQNDSWAIIQVCDQGCGIALADQRNIFEPFYRVDPSRARSTGGVGLGLSIVKALVEEMLGSVTVESTPGMGSTFSITLPLANE